MQNMEEPRKLRRLVEYFVKTLKFYELKNERLARVIFLIILLISFTSDFIPEESSLIIPINVAGITVIFIASSVYLAAFLKDLKGEEYNIGICFKLVAKKGCCKMLHASDIIIIVNHHMSFTNKRDHNPIRLR